MKAILLFLTAIIALAINCAGQTSTKTIKKITDDDGFKLKLQQAESCFNNSEYDSCITISTSVLEANNAKTNATTCLAKEWKCRSQIKLGKYAEAKPEIETLLEIAQGNDKALYAQVLVDKSEILLQKGYADAALEIISEAEAICQEIISTHTELATTIYDQKAIIYWSIGSVEPAIAYAFKALQIQKESKTASPIYQARVLNNIGLIMLKEQIDEARNYFLQAKEIYEKINKANLPEYANLLNNIALVYKSKLQYADALKTMDDVLAIRKKKYPENHPNIAFVYATKATLYFDSGNVLDSELEIKKALKIYQISYGTKHPEIASCYNLLGQIAMGKKEINDGLKYFQKALIANSFSFLDSLNLKANPIISDANQAELFCSTLLLKAHGLAHKFNSKTLKLRDLHAAIHTLESADTLIWKLKNTRTNKNDKIRLGKWSSEIYETLIQHHVALAQYTKNFTYHQSKAFVYAERNKASVLAAAIAEAQSKHFAGIPDSLIANEDLLKKEITFCEKEIAQNTDKSTQQTFRNRLFILNKQYQNLVAMMEKQYPKYHQLKYQRDDNFTEKNVQKTLSENEAVVSYTIDEANASLYSFVVTNKKLKIYTDSLPANFDRLITAVRNSIVYHTQPEYEKAAFRLYEILIKNKIPKNIQTLYWIPDGRLGLLPLEVLLIQKPKAEVTYKNLPYLIKKYNISSHYSAQMLCHTDVEKQYTTDICLAAPVEFKNSEGNLANRLPATVDEVTEIAAHFKSNQKSTQIFTYATASESLLKSGAFDKSRYIHLATHGWVDEKQPELSKIILPEKPNSQEDGMLYSGEIYNLKLNSELITLSACQTGLGKITKGEGMIGLSRSLLYAGARNVLVSLWSVSDQSTFLLMRNFYDSLLGNKTNIHFSPSLKAAKLTLIQSEKYADPYYWAGFTLLGR